MKNLFAKATYFGKVSLQLSKPYLSIARDDEGA